MSAPTWGRFLALAAAVLALDQVTKALATARLAPLGSIAVIPGLFDLTYIRNQGAVFGLLRNLHDPWRTGLLTLVPLAAILFVLTAARRTPSSDRLARVGLALVLGGAIGNLIDRLRLGSVVDFFDFYWAGHHWPAFNCADSAICAGVGVLLLDLALRQGTHPAVSS